jgi:hypothetical protein
MRSYVGLFVLSRGRVEQRSFAEIATAVLLQDCFTLIFFCTGISILEALREGWSP